MHARPIRLRTAEKANTRKRCSAAGVFYVPDWSCSFFLLQMFDPVFFLAADHLDKAVVFPLQAYSATF
jgi:hypothetical protein